jgi:hypothetical protein
LEAPETHLHTLQRLWGSSGSPWLVPFQRGGWCTLFQLSSQTLKLMLLTGTPHQLHPSNTHSKPPALVLTLFSPASDREGGQRPEPVGLSHTTGPWRGSLSLEQPADSFCTASTILDPCFSLPKPTHSARCFPTTSSAPISKSSPTPDVKHTGRRISGLSPEHPPTL